MVEVSFSIRGSVKSQGVLSIKTGLLYLEESVLEGGSLEFEQLCAPTDQKEGPEGFAWV